MRFKITYIPSPSIDTYPFDSVMRGNRPQGTSEAINQALGDTYPSFIGSRFNSRPAENVPGKPYANIVRPAQTVAEW